MPRIKKTELAWAAGFIEGEGNFANSNGKGIKGVCVNVPQVNIQPLRHLKALFGGRLFVGKNYHHDGYTRQRLYRWYVTGDAARAVAQSIRPWMSAKRQKQIDKVLSNG